MSITLKQVPPDFSSIHEELWHVVESSNKNTDGFKYIFDVYKDGVLLTRVKISPTATDKYGVIDLHNIVRASLSTPSMATFDPFDIASNLNYGADVFFADYDVRYGEISGGVLSANITSGTYRAYNNYLRKTYENATTSLSSGIYFLTNRPSRTKIYSEDGALFTVLSLRSNAGVNYEKRTYIGGVLTDTHAFVGTGGAHTFGMSYETDFEFRLYNTDTNTLLGTKYYDLACKKYDGYILIFLNAFGGYDSFTFVNGVIMQDNDKKKYERYEWQLDGFTMTNQNGFVYNEGIKTYANTITTKMKLTSDVLGDEYVWLSELINSPLIYLYVPTQTAQEFHPVQITNTNYEFKNKLKNKTEVLEVEIEFANKGNTQFR